MGNTSSTSHSSGQGASSSSFTNVSGRFSAFRRMMWRRRMQGGFCSQRSEDYEAFERLLSEDYLGNTAGAIDTPEHLITINVSYTENQRECNIYVSALNNSGDKVAEAIIYQDVAPHSESECFLSIMPPQAERISNIRFKSPFSAKSIKALCLKLTRAPEENA